MPFESASNQDQPDLMKIIKAEYTYEDDDWFDVSAEGTFPPNSLKRLILFVARNFIDSLLVVDPSKRLTVEQALDHPWITKVASSTVAVKDLLPKVRKGFNARKTFKKAIDVVKAVNKLGSNSFRSKSSRTSVETDSHKASNYLNVGGVFVVDENPISNSGK